MIDKDKRNVGNILEEIQEEKFLPKCTFYHIIFTKTLSNNEVFLLSILRQ